MNGTYTCQLVTDEGVIYTCELTFADIPRSADHQPTANHISVLPNRVRMGGSVTVHQSESETLRLTLLSATGKRVAQYTQTETDRLMTMPSVQGIYLLRIDAPSGMQTVKIIVY